MGKFRVQVERMNSRIKVFNAASFFRGNLGSIDFHKEIFFAICLVLNLELDFKPLNKPN